MLTATVQSARGDANPEAYGPSGRASATVIPVTGQGAAIPLQLRTYSFRSAIGPYIVVKPRCLRHLCLQEILMQLDKQDRQLKLEETFQSVVADYRRILGHVH